MVTRAQLQAPVVIAEKRLFISCRIELLVPLLLHCYKSVTVLILE